MKKYNQITLILELISMITSPIFIIVYWISFYELYTLCKYGKIHNNITMLFVCMFFFLAWFIILIIRITKKTVKLQQQNIDKDKIKYNSRYKVIWTYIAIILIIAITSFYGVKIYHSAINYNGKLSWFLNDLENKKTVNFYHNNIYENGIEGIFTDINKEINMPKDLYVSSSFSLNFDSNGVITSFDTYIYGKNDKGKLESYLITYNINKSEKITINLNGYVNADYNEDKLIEPLIRTMKVIPLKESVSKWNENQYGILYYGKRSFGYNIDGIVYVNLDGNTKAASSSPSEIIDYTVSVFVPDKEDIYTPFRYIFAEDLDNIKATDPLKVNKSEKVSKQSNNNTNEFYLSDKIGYRLEVTDAAAGSRAYSLNGTFDGGVTWNIINNDPFLGRIGVASGITFLNEKLGFLCLSHSGGSNGELYRTEDGGLSYKKVNFPKVEVKLNNGETYNPFNLPGMPYEEEGNLNISIGQGSDGDYNGGCKALYQSKDDGRTWEYIKEVI